MCMWHKLEKELSLLTTWVEMVLLQQAACSTCVNCFDASINWLLLLVSYTGVHTSYVVGILFCLCLEPFFTAVHSSQLEVQCLLLSRWTASTSTFTSIKYSMSF